MAEKLLYGPDEAFKVIGVGRSTGYKLLATGELPSIRIGRLRKIPVAELNRWISEKVSEEREEVAS